jgi:hypothetical protein
MNFDELKNQARQNIDQANQQKQANINELNKVSNEYSDMINSQISGYNNLMEQQQRAIEQNQENLTNQQKAQFNYQQNIINQNREKADEQRDQEAKSAYVDYMRNSSDVGQTARTFARSGLLGQGYAESTIAQMYNTYQNRVATANKALQDAYTEYDNQMQQAQMNNDSTLAQIALDSMNQKLQIALQGFEYKSTLEQQRATYLQNLNNTYYARNEALEDRISNYYSQLNNINQYQSNLAEQQRQANLDYQYKMASASARNNDYNFTDSGESSEENNEVVTSIMSPTGLSGGTAYRFVSSLPHSMTISELERRLNEANITDDDRNKIAKTYGLEWN